jgi:protein TonB
VITKGGPNEPRQMDGSIGFDTRTPTKLSTLHYQPERSKYGVHLMNAPHDVVAGATGATVLRVRAGKIDHSFALTQFGKVLKIMDECVTDLKRVWNIASDESDRQLQGATMPNGLSGLFSSKDYPALAIDAFQSGTARLAVLVDEQGKVADCSVVETSEVAVLDAQSCVIVRKRARFKPVLGAGGKPVKSGFIQRITWRME